MVEQYLEIEKSIETIKQLQLAEAKKLETILNSKLENAQVILRAGLLCNNTLRSDYRNYIWLQVFIEEQEYWLCLFSNDLDLYTGNAHSQFGRISFVKNKVDRIIVVHQTEKKKTVS